MSKPKVFVISLKRSTDRREKVAKEMADKNIEFSFFDAIDGRESAPMLAEDYDYRKRLWLTSGYMPSKGELGCYASHYALWIKCLELGEPIIVCEDDIELADEASRILSIALEKVEHYGFVRLESVEPGGECVLVERFERGQINLMKDNYGGTRAYAISPAAAHRLIKHRWSLPVDCFIGANFIHGQYSYQLEPLFVTKHGEDVSTVQDAEKKQTPLYRKPTRELYTTYKKLMLSLMYWKKRKQLGILK